jgi:D-alanyl-D-alanine carboxypeptidase
MRGGDGGQPPADVCPEGGCVVTTNTLSSTLLKTAPAAAMVCAYCNQDPEAWKRTSTTPPPAILGANAAVMEGSCGQLVYGLNHHERRPPASIAKIVSALVVADSARLSDKVDVKINGWDLAVQDGSSIAGLQAGMNLTVEELLYALLLPSGNDAAIALADHLGGVARFTEMMNRVARRAGLENSNFVNPDGRDRPDNYTSALDIALLGRQLMLNPALRTIAGAKTQPNSWDGRLMWNTNYLVFGYPGATGVKFGFTEGANETVVGSALRDGRELYVSVLNSSFAYLDAVKLLDWAFANTKVSC